MIGQRPPFIKPKMILLMATSIWLTERALDPMLHTYFLVAVKLASVVIRHSRTDLNGSSGRGEIATHTTSTDTGTTNPIFHGDRYPSTHALAMGSTVDEPATTVKPVGPPSSWAEAAPMKAIQRTNFNFCRWCQPYEFDELERSIMQKTDSPVLYHSSD